MWNPFPAAGSLSADRDREALRGLREGGVAAVAAHQGRARAEQDNRQVRPLHDLPQAAGAAGGRGAGGGLSPEGGGGHAAEAAQVLARRGRGLIPRPRLLAPRRNGGQAEREYLIPVPVCTYCISVRV